MPKKEGNKMLKNRAKTAEKCRKMREYMTGVDSALQEYVITDRNAS